MSDKSFEEREAEVREQMEDEGVSVFDAYGEDLYADGMTALDMSGSRKGGKIILPNERLAIFWAKVFNVQFTDGGWRDTETDFQLEHPFSYSNAEIVIDRSRSTPRFEAYNTHEKMETPLNHFDPVPQFYGDMIYLVRLHTGDDSYGMSELKEDLRAFDSMEFDVAPKEKCSRCNPEIY